MPHPSRRAIVTGLLAGAGFAGPALAMPEPISSRFLPSPRAAPLPRPESVRPEPLPEPLRRGQTSRADPELARMYGPVTGEPFPVPAAPLDRIDAAFLRQEVADPTGEAPGTLVVDPKARYLYHVLDRGRAMRYGVGVGKQGFAWSGEATVESKQMWPDWYPPKEMVERQPELKPRLTTLQSGLGVAGGPSNPLGARAHYLWQGGKDTLYRIHGTVEPWTIGRSVSSGCIRMINQDVIHLYDRVQLGARVVVLGSSIGTQASTRTSARETPGPRETLYGTRGGR